MGQSAGQNDEDPMGESDSNPVSQTLELMDHLLGLPNESCVMIDGVSCACLIDTGSMLTTRGSGFLEKCLPHIEVQSLEHSLNVEGAGGKNVPCLGYIMAKMSFQCNTAGTVDEVSITILVVPETNYSLDVPLMVGTNVRGLCKDTCKKQNGARFLQVTMDTAWRLAYHSLTARERYIKDGMLETVKPAWQRRITVDANQTTNISGFILAPPRGETITGMIEQLQSSTLPGSLVVTPRVFNITSDGTTCRIPIEVRNLSKKPVHIDPSMPLCVLQAVNIVGPSYGPLSTCRIYRHTASSTDDTEVKGSKIVPSIDSVVVDDSLLTAEQSTVVHGMLKKWEPLFAEKDSDLGHSSVVQHKISLIDDTRFKERHRCVPPGMLDEVREHIKMMLATGVIGGS